VSEEPGRVHTTRPGTLVGLTAGGLVIGWFLVPFFQRINTTVPQVRWSAVLVLVFIAAVLGSLAWTTYRTIHRRHDRIEPQKAVNLLVLAKASALAGALVAGAYLGFGAQFLDSMDVAVPHQRVVRSAFAAGASLLVCAGGLLLERACRVPRDPDEDSRRTP
jgi:Protein of unknown function (DUF3180)